MAGIDAQALSHCVFFSLRDLLDVWPENRYGVRPAICPWATRTKPNLNNVHTYKHTHRVRDLIFLHNMSSPVPGFEVKGQQFKRFFILKGMRLEPSSAPR